ncbi:MAG: hypothetical protein U1E27_05060, partial [Kiritimatiellia bacterium]|nr:hypothetical protein [Kiritimatiellia bacterium]
EWIANFARSRHLTGVGPDENQYYSASPFLEKGFHDVGRFGRLRFVEQSEPGVPVVRNGRFLETDARGLPLHWSVSADDVGQVSLDERVFRTGGRSLRLEGREGGTVQLTQLLPELKPDTAYLLTYFMKTEAIQGEGRQIGAMVNVWTDRNEWFPSNWQRGDLAWSKMGFVIQPNSGINQKRKSYMRLRITGSGAVWFDDVQIRALDTLTPERSPSP